MPSRAPTLSELERELFDPRKDPLLRPGFVTPQHVATQAELAAAADLLSYRRANYGWRLEPLDEEALGAVRACLEASAARTPPDAGSAGEDPAPSESQHDALEGRLFGRLPWRPLPFYPGGRLIHIPAGGNGAAPPAAAERVMLYGAAGTSTAVQLNGGSLPIHQANDAAPFDASPKGALEEYVSFFCEHVHASDGGFYAIEEAGIDEGGSGGAEEGEPLLPAGQPLPELYHMVRDHRRSGELSPEDLSRFAAALEEAGPPVRASIAHPITRIAAPADDTVRTYVIATIIYARSPFRSVLAIDPGGMIEMLEDQFVADAAVAPLSPRWLPKRIGA